MTTKDIRTSHAHTVCDVCGRTLLRGERAEIYINGGARRSVCELCRPRALHEGWVREGTLPDYSQSGSGSERRRSLLNRLRGRGGPRRPARPSLDDELAGYEPPLESVRRRPNGRPRFEDQPTDERWDEHPPADLRADDDWDYGEPSPADVLDAPPAYEPEDYSESLPDEVDPEPPGRRPWSRPPRSLRSRPEPRRGGPDRQVEAREPRHVRAVPAGDAQKIASAIALFNQSEHRRTVAGVARSLGGAGVAVLPAAEPPSLVHIVVWWELCWYRYSVDLSDAVPGVRVDGQGYELSELSEAERSANAGADESGQLILH